MRGHLAAYKIALSRRFGIGFAFPEKKEPVKQTSRILGALALAILPAAVLCSCGKERTIETATATAAPTPVNEVDAMINDYEKATNEYLKVSKKLSGGDVSVTVKYIDLGKELREWPTKHGPMWAKMTPQQAQRAAGISARTASLLQK